MIYNSDYYSHPKKVNKKSSFIIHSTKDCINFINALPRFHFPTTGFKVFFIICNDKMFVASTGLGYSSRHSER